MSSNRLSPLLGKCSASDLIAKIKRLRLFPKKVELQALMKYYDINGDGSITYEEFLNGLR